MILGLPFIGIFTHVISSADHSWVFGPFSKTFGHPWLRL